MTVEQFINTFFPMAVPKKLYRVRIFVRGSAIDRDQPLAYGDLGWRLFGRDVAAALQAEVAIWYVDRETFILIVDRKEASEE